MDALISLVYTIIDSVCVCLFLDAFASHRWRDHRFLVGVIVQTILMYCLIKPPKPYTLFLAKQSVASNVFVYTKTLLAGGMPQAPLICIFQCRLRIPSGRFLSGDVLRVVEDLYEVRSGFCQRSILHLFRDRRIQKRNAPFLHTEKANLNKLRGMQHRKVAHRAYRR